jgi:protein TonB
MPVAVVSKNEFDGGGVSGTNAPSGIANGGRAFSLNQVDAQAEPLGDNPAPRYPESLRAAAIRGIVLAQFVVDTTGRVEAGSFVALRADNYLFAESVKAALAKARFHPAQVGGRPVRQLVQQSFSFMLE